MHIANIKLCVKRCVIGYYCIYNFTDLDQAEFFMSGLKRVIENQNTNNKVLQNKVERLQLQNEMLTQSNVDYFGKIKLLEKELKLKNSM